MQWWFFLPPPFWIRTPMIIASPFLIVIDRVYDFTLFSAWLAELNDSPTDQKATKAQARFWDVTILRGGAPRVSIDFMNTTVTNGSVENDTLTVTYELCGKLGDGVKKAA